MERTRAVHCSGYSLLCHYPNRSHYSIFTYSLIPYFELTNLQIVKLFEIKIVRPN